MTTKPLPKTSYSQNPSESERQEILNLLQELHDKTKMPEEIRQLVLDAFVENPEVVLANTRRYYQHIMTHYVPELGGCNSLKYWDGLYFDTTAHEKYAHEADVSFKIMADLAEKHVKTDDWVLDLGCGTGLATRPIAKKGAITTGIDQSMKMLEAFRRQKVANLLPGIQVMLDHDTRIPFDDGRFHHVVSNGVLYYIVGGIESTISECARVLKSPSRDNPQGGGMLHFSITCTQGMPHELRTEVGPIINQEVLDNTGGLAFYYDWEDILRILHENHFEVIENFDKSVHTESGCENEVIYTFVSAKKVA